MSKIDKIRARQVLDSRGNPTVEVDIILSDGAMGQATGPSGASTGKYEAFELRDGDPTQYRGMGVQKAIANVHKEIAPELVGRDGMDQESVDRSLVDLDGTHNKSNLGSNAILAVSLAFAKARSASKQIALYQYYQRGDNYVMPVPMLNIINGGQHALNSTDFQEFMIIPAGFTSMKEAVWAGAAIYHVLGQILIERGFGRTVGDEGGFAPPLASDTLAMEIIIEAIERAGYKPGVQCFIGVDAAATELQVGPDLYAMRRSQTIVSSDDMINLYEQWKRDYPLISIEDSMGEDDWEKWSKITDQLGDRVQIVGDDLYTTNPDRIREGVRRRASNAVLIKPNQIATITETIEAVEIAQSAEWGIVISHRSGETEDVSIADMAVGTSAGQIKTGAPARSDRTSKYNRLLRIEEELGDRSTFAGIELYERFFR